MSCLKKKNNNMHSIVVLKISGYRDVRRSRVLVTVALCSLIFLSGIPCYHMQHYFLLLANCKRAAVRSLRVSFRKVEHVVFNTYYGRESVLSFNELVYDCLSCQFCSSSFSQFQYFVGPITSSACHVQVSCY